MPTETALISFIVASILIVIVPGPTVTVIIGNSLKYGSRAGLLNVIGTQIGLMTMIAVLAIGYSAAVAGMGSLFELLRLIGAAYLIWLGVRMWCANGRLNETSPRIRPLGSFIIQGFLVIWSNPKALLFFGAFIPQFVDPGGSIGLQVILLGFIFMIVGAIFDGLYAIAAGNARNWLSQTRIGIAERIAGCCLIGGGLWLALARR